MADVDPGAAAPEQTSNANGGTYVDSIKNSKQREPFSRSSSIISLSDKPLSDSSAAMNTIANHPVTQSVRNGPVAESVKNQTAKAGNDISGLSSKRAPPDQPAVTGQPLTHYHSFFYSLLSWEHPRATGISFASTVLFIFAARYMPVLRWIFKATFTVLGCTAAAEVAGKYLAGHGLASSFRPRRYYTIPRETLDATMDDLEQLVNFFVIESQRILFAENIPKTVATFMAALVSYYLVKFVPLWGLTLLTACVVYLAPLIYITNQELIDEHVAKATDIVNSQANQVKSLAGQHTSRATETMKQYAGDYGAKAQEYIGTARQRMPSPTLTKAKPATSSTSTVKDTDFPAAPQQDPMAEVRKEAEAIPS
ncbi:MAG: hypothetical protein Q9227_009399 [Pyrenula ochraceoflavens]